MARAGSKDAFNYIGTACCSSFSPTHTYYAQDEYTTSREIANQVCTTVAAIDAAVGVSYDETVRTGNKSKARACLCKGQKPLFRTFNVPVRINFLDSPRILNGFWTTNDGDGGGVEDDVHYSVFQWERVTRFDFSTGHYTVLCCNSPIPFKIKGPFSQVFLHRNLLSLSCNKHILSQSSCTSVWLAHANEQTNERTNEQTRTTINLEIEQWRFLWFILSTFLSLWLIPIFHDRPKLPNYRSTLAKD